MPEFINRYVRFVDKLNYRIGRITMLMIFAMVGVLFFSAISKAFFRPSLWTYEFAQFLMVAYFVLGGAYSIQLKGHVRMDLLYSKWKSRTQSKVDSFTSLFMIAYLVLLLYGSVSSTIYSIEFGERSYSIWRPYMWPIKVVISIGMLFMLMQAISQFFKDLAIGRGKPLS